MWLLKSTKSIAFQKDLYSSLNGDEECDEIERWLNEQFETPVKEPLSKAINGDKLDYNNFYIYIYFLFYFYFPSSSLFFLASSCLFFLAAFFAALFALLSFFFFFSSFFVLL